MKILNKFDSNMERLNESEVVSAIEKCIEQHADSEIPLELLAEQAAFQFCENYQDEATGWGTYYGPMVVWRRDDGTIFVNPSIGKITPEILDYWSKRAVEAKHPILKARYADLVWDFSKTVTKTSANVQIAYIAIDSRVEISLKDLHEYETHTIEHLRRALFLASSLNDVNRIEEVRDSIIDYEHKIAQDDKPGLWGFSYDSLIENKKVLLPSQLEHKIIEDLENRLDRLTQSTEGMSLDNHRWNAKAAATRLASYYRKHNGLEEAQRILKIYYNGFRGLVSTSPAFLAADWLREIYMMFLDYGLKEEADQIATVYRDVAFKTLDDMKPISVETDISEDALNEYINSVIDGNINQALIKIALHFTPERDEIIRELEKLSKQSPLTFLITKQIVDYEGRPVASVGSLEDDLEGNIIHQMTQDMSFDAFFLNRVIAALVDKFDFTHTKFVEYLYLSPVFNPETREIIEKGIQLYIKGDYLMSSHLLIPQIEASIRNLTEIVGRPILRRGRNQRIQIRLLDDLLRDEQIVKTLGEDMAFYFRVLLTDQRGWNLRNRVAHGLMRRQDFDRKIANRIVHSLFCLALVRETTEDKSTE